MQSFQKVFVSLIIWDALCELYLDFYWIDTLNIVIIHENLSKLSFDDFRMYISIVLY